MKHIAPGAFALATPLAAARPRAVTPLGVRADASDPKKMLAELQTAFESFKAEHDAKLKAKADDVVVNEKVDRINDAVGNFQKAIDDLNAKMAAGALGSPNGDQGKPRDPEYSQTWASFFREGDRSSEDYLKAKAKEGPRAAMSAGSNADGGYLAPVEWDRTITGKLKEVSPIRQNASVVSVGGAGFRKVFNDRSVGSGWVGETATRPATSTPQLGILDFITGEIYAFPFVTRQILEDAEVNVETWLGDEVKTEFSRQENIAFLSGDGVNKPFGLLTYVTGAANAAKHPWGAIATVNTGAAAALTADGFINLFYDLPASYRTNAKLYTNRLSQAAMRKLKDGQGNYLWQPSFAAGQPATLGGESIVEIPDMPGVGANNIAALYGDMAATYVVVDRRGVLVLRDELTNKPYVGFYTTRRVGGGVQNPEPMRALKVAA
ncbi:phage major capsid protein [Antarcticirhabdus aurantiaca]|uniref:Phage major capsid protein n=1 Tax=Antarcticirhabdus aurantiaca TaxID=2606717 RepID=A0ACD4NRP6_9HYPH|nr:phage major capsid protein [Jeongeuplla avenae]